MKILKIWQNFTTNPVFRFSKLFVNLSNCLRPENTSIRHREIAFQILNNFENFENLTKFHNKFGFSIFEIICKSKYFFETRKHQHSTQGSLHLRFWTISKISKIRLKFIKSSFSMFEIICKSKQVCETRKHHYSTQGSLHLRFWTISKISKIRRNFTTTSFFDVRRYF